MRQNNRLFGINQKDVKSFFFLLEMIDKLEQRWAVTVRDNTAIRLQDERYNNTTTTQTGHNYIHYYCI